MNSQFLDILFSIQADLNAHKRNKQELKQQYIQDRLNKSLSTYYKELCQSMQYLSDKDEMNIARKLNKEVQ